MIRSLWGVVLGLVVMLLASCGGGGSDAGDCVIGCSGDGGTTAKVAELRIALSSNTIDLTSPSPVTVTVTAVNASNQAVADAAVTVSVNEEGNILANASKTDSAGVLTAILDAGSKKTVRVLTVTAISGTISKQAAVAVVEGGPSSPVTDLRITVSSSSIDAAAPAPVLVTVTAVNASNQTVSNAPVTLSVDAGALITAAAAKTDGSGVLGGTLELGSNRAVRPLTVTAISGAIAKSAVVSVIEGSPSAAVAELRVTAANSTISNKAPSPVEVTVQAVNANNLPVSGAPVTVRADQGGVVTAGSATTSAAGTLTVTLGMGSDTTPRVITLTATSGSKTGTGNVTVVDGFNAGTASVALTLSSTTVSNSAASNVNVTLLDAKGAAVPNAVVTFSSEKGLGRFSANSALTDAQGKAQVQLSPASSTSAGADYVLVSAQVNGVDVTSKAGFSVIAIPIQIQSLTSDAPAGVGPYGQTNIDVVLSGTLPGVPVTLQAVSQCTAVGKATLLPALLTTSIGSGSFVLKDNQCGVNSNSDTVTVSVVGSTASKSIQIPIGKPSAASLAFVSASPSVIYLKGSGFTESSTVTFQVRDSSANPLPNVPVTLSLVNATGGVALEGANVPRNSDSNGQVSGRVIAGTVPTPVRVRAELSDTPAVSTVSSGLSVAVGLPSQQNFSLSQKTINIEGWNYDGTSNSYTIIASDRMGNPVPDDTAINFVTEGGGQIASQAFTKSVAGLSSATATFQSSEPRPADGRVTILAYALGEESFLDLNGNNVWDGGNSAEPFQDLGDAFVSRRFVSLYDPLVDQTFSLSNSTSNCAPNTNPLLPANATIPSIGTRCDNAPGRNFVRRATETVLSTSSPEIYIFRGGVNTPLGLPGNATLNANCSTRSIVSSSDGVTTSTFYSVSTGIFNATGGMTLLLADSNPNRLNPMPAGTKVTVSGTDGLAVKVLGGTPVVSTSEATTIGVSVGFDATTTAGTLFITTETPKGLFTSVPVPVFKGAANSQCAQ